MAGEVKDGEPSFRFFRCSDLVKAWAASGAHIEGHPTAQALTLSNAFVCASCGPGRCDGTTLDCTLDSYYANPANGPRPSAGTAQNPSPYGAWPGYSYPATRYDDCSPPTERLPAPVLKCECGSGSSVRSGAHSHWCPCWVAP